MECSLALLHLCCLLSHGGTPMGASVQLTCLTFPFVRSYVRDPTLQKSFDRQKNLVLPALTGCPLPSIFVLLHAHTDAKLQRTVCQTSTLFDSGTSPSTPATDLQCQCRINSRHWHQNPAVVTLSPNPRLLRPIPRPHSLPAHTGTWSSVHN
jgi:hypothetical protein